MKTHVVHDKLEVPVKLLNRHLVCPLCSGYFRSACTIVECLHSFCKVCLYRHFQVERDNYTCPTCATRLRPDPMRNSVKIDFTLQNIVDKVFPQFHQEEQKLRTEMQSGTTTEKPTEKPTTRKRRSSNKQAQPVVEEQKKTFEHCLKQVTLHLKYDPQGGSLAGLRDLDKPVIVTSAELTIQQLKKFIAIKLDIDKDSIDILCCGEVLGSQHNLEFVKKTRWHSTEDHPMVLQFAKKTDTFF